MLFNVADANIPEGWYPDPTDKSQHRYWDGKAWTEDRRPLGSAGEPIATSRGNSKGKLKLAGVWLGVALSLVLVAISPLMFSAVMFCAGAFAVVAVLLLSWRIALAPLLLFALLACPFTTTVEKQSPDPASSFWNSQQVVAKGVDFNEEPRPGSVNADSFPMSFKGVPAGKLQLDYEGILSLDNEICSYSDRLTYKTFNWLPYPNFTSGYMEPMNAGCLDKGWDDAKLVGVASSKSPTTSLWISGITLAGGETNAVREIYLATFSLSRSSLLWALWSLIVVSLVLRRFRGQWRVDWSLLALAVLAWPLLFLFSQVIATAPGDQHDKRLIQQQQDEVANSRIIRTYEPGDRVSFQVVKFTPDNENLRENQQVSQRVDFMVDFVIPSGFPNLELTFQKRFPNSGPEIVWVEGGGLLSGNNRATMRGGVQLGPDARQTLKDYPGESYKKVLASGRSDIGNSWIIYADVGNVDRTPSKETAINIVGPTPGFQWGELSYFPTLSIEPNLLFDSSSAERLADLVTFTKIDTPTIDTPTSPAQ